MSKQKADEILNKIADEQKGGKPFSVRLTPTEREWLGKLARDYKRPMGDVVSLLIQQAIVDKVMDGEVLALSKY